MDIAHLNGKGNFQSVFLSLAWKHHADQISAFLPMFMCQKFSRWPTHPAVSQHGLRHHQSRGVYTASVLTRSNGLNTNGHYHDIIPSLLEGSNAYNSYTITNAGPSCASTNQVSDAGGGQKHGIFCFNSSAIPWWFVMFLWQMMLDVWLSLLVLP